MSMVPNQVMPWVTELSQASEMQLRGTFLCFKFPDTKVLGGTGASNNTPVCVLINHQAKCKCLT